ncbi:hypothetical protein MMC19_005732 [Ptychographa xylographoides]|nr:hypothetical protein [Ptychographa xylographoides]
MPADGYLAVDEGDLYWVLDDADPADVRTGPLPTLLFIHAGVADHTLWDEQARFFTRKGWRVLRYDLLGYGKSHPSTLYLNRTPRPAVKHFEHAAHIVRNMQRTDRMGTAGLYRDQVVVVGLSRGGCIATDLALAHPDLVCGLAVVAAGLSGFDHPNTAEEEEMCAHEAALSESHDVNGVAACQVKYWGDGPAQKEGRLDPTIRQKLYAWCEDIAVREFNGTGGFAIREIDLDPPASGRLSQLRVPVAVAIGVLDESSTVATMEYVGTQAPDVTLHEFAAAHMVNLEVPDSFNSWLCAWLEQCG